jgi:hypothetical protein
VGAVAARSEEVRRGGRGRDGLRWAGYVARGARAACRRRV